jgi:hypothetical protein
LITFKQFVTELFKKSADFEEVATSLERTSRYHFEHGGHQFAVTASHPDSRGKSKVAFSQLGGKLMDVAGTHPHTAHHVFATVGKIMQHHATKHPRTKNFEFTSSKYEPSRGKLYAHMTKKMGGMTFEDGDLENVHVVPAKALKESVELDESAFQDKIHHNPSAGTLKALARANKYGTARFVIYKDGSHVAGDSEKYTHHDIAPAMGAWHARGLVVHHEGNYHYICHEPYSALNRDHPLLRTLEKAGIKQGQPKEE